MRSLTQEIWDTKFIGSRISRNEKKNPDALPGYPVTFWSYKYVLKYISKRAAIRLSVY